MSNPIETNAIKLLTALFENNPQQNLMFDGADISSWTGLQPMEINNCIDYLEDQDLITRHNYLGTHPYNFGHVLLNSRGIYFYHELQNVSNTEETAQSENFGFPLTLAVGSPYGFTDVDRNYVQIELLKKKTLKVVLGYQFQSIHYNSEKLKENLKNQFQESVDNYNSKFSGEKLILNFKGLAAGYGEHLFNQIAREIISADIVLFETSDLNPNVMIELGVALTWGKSVLPIKKHGCDKPPTDISGQTYADYINDAETFISSNHDTDMFAMVERVIMKKQLN